MEIIYRPGSSHSYQMSTTFLRFPVWSPRWSPFLCPKDPDILYSTLLYSTPLHSTLLYSTILYYTILDYTIIYYTTLYYPILYHGKPYIRVCNIRCYNDPTWTLWDKPKGSDLASQSCSIVDLKCTCRPGAGHVKTKTRDPNRWKEVIVYSYIVHIYICMQLYGYILSVCICAYI